jgi:hypothetical protein
MDQYYIRLHKSLNLSLADEASIFGLSTSLIFRGPSASGKTLRINTLVELMHQKHLTQSGLMGKKTIKTFVISTESFYRSSKTN